MSIDDEALALLSVAASAIGGEDASVDVQVEKRREEPEIKSHADLLKSLFDALDVKLSLYFTCHTSSAELDALLRELSKIIRREIKVHHVLQILFIWPGSFKVVETTSGKFLIDVSDLKFHRFQERKAKFHSLVDEWVRQHGEEEIPCHEIQDTVQDARDIRVKVLKQSNFRLKNNPKDFEFKEKTDHPGVLTLLERIRAKEKHQKQKSKENVRISQKDSKLKAIYDILFSLQLTAGHKTFTLINIFQKVKDSYKTSIHEDDIFKSLASLSRLLGHEKVEIIEVKGLKFLKLSNLSRSVDLETIEAINSTRNS